MKDGTTKANADKVIQKPDPSCPLMLRRAIRQRCKNLNGKPTLWPG